MIRIYIESIYSSTLTLDDKQLHYLKNVMRCNDEDIIEIFDNKNAFKAKILFPNIEIIENLSTVMRKRPKLGIGYIRKNKLEVAIEKAVELDVDEIYLLITDRVNRKYIDSRRLNKIAIEAAEQCGRIGVPKIHENIKLIDLPDIEWVVADSSQNNKKDFWNGDGMLIGPEGGWSDNELNALNKYKKISLHHNILRAETAVCAGLSLFSNSSE
ncbi:16S rRNA (uracil(1498)-N(3))-methyltransferase [Candidatus Cytomitobacter indipagum]|uniref:Ribosomal RNA small subunit methyltransferase E n=1 Tax=Candidatus Cytomitobacter indipagum TaxID=2601575 RepID=A0A5C0UF06_9PROT|nr:RsmE family RNA methyltransferase [Candidatus Cytomitobacter indipagum]QEK38223.1 16S rRNA (uracil(1498)-N(3))-methyltransferase [Candidatus Cytomitobacter indipagum]